jgi:hypothetical protein
MIPQTKTNPFRAALAALDHVEASSLPLQAHDYVWQAMVPAAGQDLTDRIEQVGAAFAQLTATPTRRSAGLHPKCRRS